ETSRYLFGATGPPECVDGRRRVASASVVGERAEVDPPQTNAKDAGRQAIASVRRALGQRVVETLKARDPRVLENLVEVGIIRRDFVEDPEHGPLSNATPISVIERLLERSVEQRPSLLATLGLSTIQMLSTPGDDGDGIRGTSTRLSVAFTDLEGFTAHTATVGDEAASRLVSDHQRALGPIVRSRGGRIVKRLGDGTILTFNEPEAAVLACLELVAEHPAPLRLRAGVHLGDVVVTRDDVFGHVVNVAARVTESASGGEVLVTADVASAAGELQSVRFAPPRSLALKGLDEPISVLRAERG
ncbi:MAG TPA: adenylate/guanylate cyclase domain-containing protein, partial [Acidimicrobiales bacterium]|nr:adenylate/guanylate cyclase domain-containing protein [Acidimicrobiales bacterium]